MARRKLRALASMNWSQVSPGAGSRWVWKRFSISSFSASSSSDLLPRVPVERRLLHAEVVRASFVQWSS